MSSKPHQEYLNAQVSMKQLRTVSWSLVVAILVSFFLLIWQLGSLSVWVDELSTLNVIQRDSISGVIRGVIEGERRPPLYFVLLHWWGNLTGFNEFALRFFSITFAVLALPLLYRLGMKVAGPRVGLLAAFVLAVSPFMVLYGRMIRYYPLTLFLALLSTLFFLRLLSRAPKGDWAAYLASTWLLLATDYPAVAMVAAQNLFLGFAALRRTVSPGPIAISAGFIPKWALGQVIILAIYPVWLGPLVIQFSREKIQADLASSAFGYLLKLAYPFFSFSVGETIFPWHPAAILGLITALAMVGIGVRKLPPPIPIFIWSTFLLTLLSTALILSLIATDIPFINMASRSAFVSPLFYLALATGISRIRFWPWGTVALLFLLSGNGFSLWNYYLGRDFHNPIYSVPIKEVVGEVTTALSPGDIIISEGDSAFAHYYGQGKQIAPHFLTDQREETKAYIESNKPARIWLVTMGRDRTREVAPTELVAWLATEYEQTDAWGYGEQDPFYRRVKELLLRRPAYEYKLVGKLYSRRGR